MSSFYTSVARKGNKIFYRGYADGKQFNRKGTFSPVMFFPSNTETDWKDITGKYVKPKKFSTMSEARDAIDQYSGVEGFDVHGMDNFVYQFITSMYPNDIEYDFGLIRIGNFDIEVGSDEGFPKPDEALYPIQSIAYSEIGSELMHVYGMGEFDPSKMETKEKTVRYIQCSSEVDLLTKFFVFLLGDPPDVFTGWNIRFFDIPYLVNRVRRLMGEGAVKKLSPWGIVNYREVFINGKSNDTYEIGGIEQLDYLEVFKKFDYVYGTPESYSLDTICHMVLGEKKMSYEEYGSLHTLYKENYQKFIEYNIRDVMLVEKLEERVGLLEQAITIAYKGGVTFKDTLGTTAIWDSIIYRHLNKMNIAVPPKEKKVKSSYPGGYVKEPIPGKYEWVVSFDLNSLYPNLIVQYNMSPETLVKTELARGYGADHYLENPPTEREMGLGFSIAANGSMYRKDFQGVLPSIIVDYYNERREIKKKMLEKKSEYEKTHDNSLLREIDILDNGQMAVKILLNSLYGALGNAYFRYFEMSMAEGITISGQLAIKWAERVMNKAMNKIMNTEDVDYVCAIDTDSLYVDFSSFVKKYDPKTPVDFISSAANRYFVPELNKGYTDMYEHMNAYAPRMEMSREVIADSGVWTAKKRYILSVLDNEGVRYEKPKIKVMGIEAVKSSTPQVVRDVFMDCFKMVLSEDESKLHNYIADFRERFSSLEPEEVSFPRGVSEIDKWVGDDGMPKKGCPIHVRGAIVYNYLLRKKGLDNKYDLVNNGSKVKFCYLREPNPAMSYTISYPSYLPKELGLHQYVDYNKQFEKSFISPMQLITSPVGWTTERINSLFD